MATSPKPNFLTKKTKARGKRKSVSPNLFYEYSVLFRKDADNVIFQVTSDQLPILNRIGLDDLFMTKGHIREPPLASKRCGDGLCRHRRSGHRRSRSD